MISDYLTYVIKHLRRRRLRSWLTLLGIFIGMAAVVALFSLSQGLKDAVVSQFESLGANRIIVEPGGTMAGPFSSSLSLSKLKDKDLKTITAVRGVDFAVGLVTSVSSVRFRDEYNQGYIIGLPVDSDTINNLKEIGILKIKEGRAFKPASRYDVILGDKVAHDFFDENLTTKDSVYIKGRKFRVIGILDEGGVGMSPMGIFMPKSVVETLFKKDDYGFIPVKVADGYNAEDVAERIKNKLRKERNVKEGEEDFSVETENQVIESFSRVLNIVQVLIISVASISLVVGGVGIMNTMYTAIAERTKEIGIMKAVGARNSSILLIFLLESGGLGLVGGLIGAFLGLLTSKLTEIIAEKQLGSKILVAHISPGMVLGVLLFSFVLGALAGYLPARKASRMQPVKALRKI